MQEAYVYLKDWWSRDHMQCMSLSHLVYGRVSDSVVWIGFNKHPHDCLVDTPHFDFTLLVYMYTYVATYTYKYS